jgi:hypothetical protein
MNYQPFLVAVGRGGQTAQIGLSVFVLFIMKYHITLKRGHLCEMTTICTYFRSRSFIYYYNGSVYMNYHSRASDPRMPRTPIKQPGVPRWSSSGQKPHHGHCGTVYEVLLGTQRSGVHIEVPTIHRISHNIGLKTY